MTNRGVNAFAMALVYISIRAQLANRMPITDCDEVYNYWEPLHFLAFKSGMQTWEYASQFALRTYAYLYPLWNWMQFLTSTFPTWWLRYMAQILTGSPVEHSEKLVLFIILRSTLAAIMGAAEVNWLMAMCEDVPFRDSLIRQPLISRTVAFATGICLLTSTGMAHASGALLPSSTFLLAFLLCSSAYVRQQIRLFIVVAVTATLGIGWPFGVIVLVPMGVHILWMRRSTIVSLLIGTALFTLFCQAVIMAIDYRHYGRWTSATLNIFMYNAAGGGDELYGIEPTSYYVKNLALNFNYLAALAPFVVPVLGIRRSIVGRPSPAPLSVLCSSLYFWFATVIPRPHKEERFLFPIYPVICLGAVVVVEQVWDTFGTLLARKSGYYRPYWMLFLLPSCGIGLLRIAALSKYYTAPLDVYAHLPTTSMPKDASSSSSPNSLVCTCGEWYRFPSSFYLADEQRVAFLRSSFSGQLPRQFEALGSMANASSFNDLNEEEMDRYVALDHCAYLIEMEGSDCFDSSSQESLEPLYVSSYLDASSTSTLHRTIYLPFGLHKGTYLNYTLFRVNPH